jgi:hypothetical protein
MTRLILRLSFLLFLTTGCGYLRPSGLSFSLYHNLKTPIIDTPIDYSVITTVTYNDNIDLYYAQQRANGYNDREYWVQLQRPVWRDIWLSGKRMEGIESDLWMVDVKYVNNKNNWTTAYGYSNCWEDGKYIPKLLFEERKTFKVAFFLCPFDFSISTKLLTDTDKLLHEEKIEMKFLVNMPRSFKLNQYINTYIKLYILSKDYGYYRYRHNLMLEVNYK